MRISHRLLNLIKPVYNRYEYITGKIIQRPIAFHKLNFPHLPIDDILFPIWYQHSEDELNVKTKVTEHRDHFKITMTNDYKTQIDISHNILHIRVEDNTSKKVYKRKINLSTTHDIDNVMSEHDDTTISITIPKLMTNRQINRILLP